MYFKNYILILKNLGSKMSLKKKISYLQNELNMRKENFENIEKAKIYFEKEKGKLKKKNERLISSLEKFSNG